MKKRILSAAMAVICLGAFTACTNTEENNNTETSAEETSSAEESITEEETQSEAEEQTEIQSETEEEAEVQSEAEAAEYNIASLKGPTTMGMVKLMSDSEAGLTQNKYNVTMYAAADEIVAGLVSDTVDIANVPANLSATLYKKTEKGIKVTDVNTLGVLYIVQTGNEISSVEDLRGKTIYTTGKGTSPEYVLRYVLSQNGIDPDNDVTVEFKSESTEVAAMLAEGDNMIALLPQPFVTVAMTQNENISIALDMTEEWDKVSDNSLITGVTIAKSSVIDENPEAFEIFMDEYSQSTEWVNENVDEAAALIGGYDIITEAVAKQAVPFCNITFIRGAEMKNSVNGYLSVLFEADPTSVGGELPDDGLYYAAE